MYERLTEEQYEVFKREVKLRMVLDDISVKDLSRETGYTEATLYNWFNKNTSKFIPLALAEVLEMEIANYEK